MNWLHRLTLLALVALTGGALAQSIPFPGPGGTAGYPTWDPATITAVTLSGGNLIATNTGTTGVDQGARTQPAVGKSTSKFYFEFAFTTLAGLNHGQNISCGIATPASTYTSIGNGAVTGGIIYQSGNIYSNGSNSGKTLGQRFTSDIIAVAVDLTNLAIWFKGLNNTPTTWNAVSGGTADPATNTGGVALAAGTYTPMCTFGGVNGGTGNVSTANFGASAFTGAVPSGFNSGWAGN